MASRLMSSLLAALFLTETILSLQVSSNSPCTSLCLDPSQNTTNTTPLSTLGSDITCVDASYEGTPSGQRFMACLNCLQTSTASDGNGNDQGWFLYNLRFALDSCLFGFQQPSDFVSTPCSTINSCQPLQRAIEDGNLLPSNETEFSYCSADNNAILGDYLNKCRECLSNTSNEKYLRNFLTALQAGCIQRPQAGTAIGLQGNIFSTTLVNITTPDYNPTSTSTPHKGLPQGAIIGIAVALVVLLLLAIAIFIIYYRRRRNLNDLRSPLDSRFGAANITAPTNGAYGNPFPQTPISVNGHFDQPQYTIKELTALDNARTVLEKHQISPISTSSGWIDGAHARLAGQLTNQTGTIIPTHQAYIPATWTPISPSGSTATSDTYRMKDYPSARSSPKNFPPPLILESKPPTHKKSPSAQSHPQVSQMETIHSPRAFESGSSPDTDFQPQFHTQMRSEIRNRSVSRRHGESRTRNDSRPRNESRNRAESRAESRTRAESRASSRAESRTRSRDNSLSRGEDESPRVSPREVLAQRMADEANPPRSASRAESYRRTTVRPGISNTNASKDEPLSKNGRFDFEWAERERIERERKMGLTSITKDSFKKKKAKKRPEEAASMSAEEPEEQWPGSY